MTFDPTHYQIRRMQFDDFGAITELCRRVYPHDEPYSADELSEHHAVYPQGQYVCEHSPSASVVGVHFTLRLTMTDFHPDDPWDVLTAKGTFADHNPQGHTLYGADVFVSPDHQHHSLAHALTDVTRALVVAECLWRMVGGSRLPGYGAVAALMSPEDYVAEVVAGKRSDSVLSVHLKDGWMAVRPICGYMQDDPASANCAALIQWVNPVCPPPAEFALR